MPINDPIRGRKIAPDSLAFDPDAQRGIGLVTYQQELGTNTTITNNIIGVDAKDVHDSQLRTAKLIADSKAQAHHYVGDYHNVYEWTVQTGNINLGVNHWHGLQFEKEIIRGEGCEFVGASGAIGSQWQHVCNHGQEGDWWVYGFILVTLLGSMNATTCRLALYKNGVIWRMLDGIDQGYAGEAPIITCKLSGGCHVPLVYGDVVTLELHVNNGGAPANQTISAPTSMYGYVTAHRERCDGKLINTPSVDAGTGYVFT